MKVWRSPSSFTYPIYTDMLKQTNLLIAGEIGSGKSTTVHALLHELLTRTPATTLFVLIDPKRVELGEYADMPHTLRHVSALADIPRTLEDVVDLMDRRFTDMAARHLRMFDGPRVYVVVDELIPVTTSAIKRRCIPLLEMLLSQGRAAKISVIAATQSPLRQVVTPVLRANFDSRLGLKTATAQDSRNIINVSGCEAFPDPREEGRALGYYRAGTKMYVTDLPMIPEDERQRVIQYWRDNPTPVEKR